ncbi:Uncharacterized protein dnm_099440 [Desulfonema magnum]|uniref:Uncharacterized protein n=1 Tax=Desulfonema magnum TaxID=45655 RepID=A0A975GU88_9BACT|nr:Uncharacterized protein dnm_099440 [Desulfonema magnum]
MKTLPLIFLPQFVGVDKSAKGTRQNRLGMGRAIPGIMIISFARFSKRTV